MKFSEKLEANWKAGKYTLVKDLADGEFALFTTKDQRGSVRNTLWTSQEKDTLFAHTHDVTIDKSELDKMNLKIIRTIDPMELMGSGYEEGQKVRILPNAMELCEKAGLGGFINVDKQLAVKDGFGFFKLTAGLSYGIYNKDKGNWFNFPPSAIEPYFEDEETVKIGEVTYNKAEFEEAVKNLKPIK